jgi:alpha-glucosidase (family GH31 glycosyl hydrolase)
MEHLNPSSLNPVNTEGIVADNFRLTVFTPKLLRIEYSPNYSFEDRASQVIWHRNVKPPHFTTIKENEYFVLTTDSICLKCTSTKSKPSKDTLSIEIFPCKFLKEAKIWKYGDASLNNLKGTTRTLDFHDGEVPLENGLISRDGWSIIDDSQGLVLENGWPTPRNTPVTLDIYFFAYGLDFVSCLRDFRMISGPVPLIPRYILGNWWSRFWQYSDEDVQEIVTQFKERSIPLSVFILDMDWHITETGNLSKGWTGYTWNSKLFPEYKKTIEFFHKNNLKMALNIHPADGIYPHEIQFQDFAREMNHSTYHLPIPFNLTDPHFLQHYFKILHHPYEADGVDFWWIDWQQGETTNIPGLDPLWWLNHLHFHDFQRERFNPEENKFVRYRPFIFSRYGGLGSHRYPIGFSGDTHSTWNSLAFQPYFTSTASNVGFGWWSHDIGGHYGGVKDSELYIRWLQFGVFSPIMRLHSGNKISYERLPWGFDYNTLVISRSYLQVRHALVPYIYTAAYKDHIDCEPLVKPLYYSYPFEDQAYCFPNSFFFGSEFLVSPFVTQICKETQLARQVVWIPPGDWFKINIEIFLPHKESSHKTISRADSSLIPELFKGGNCYAIYGKISEIPLFVKSGAIIPIVSPNQFIDDNITQLSLHVFLTSENQYSFYEDDGTTTEFQNNMFSLTPFSLKRTEYNNNENYQFEVGRSKGERFVSKKYQFYFYAEDDINIEIKEIKINNEKISEFVIEIDK